MNYFSIANKSKTLKIFLTVLVFISVMATALVPEMVYAKTEYSDPAESLQVNLVNGKGTTLVHDYSYADMEALADGDYVSYSSIDAFPVCVYTLAHGVFLDTLIDDATKRNDQVVFKKGCKIKLYATDGWVATYDYDYLYGKSRYYYPKLFTAWDIDTQAPGDGVDEDPESVEPMFAITSYQTRIFDNSDPLDSYNEYKEKMNRDESFRFCMGITNKELTSGKSTTAKYGRWVNRMDIILPAAKNEQESNDTSVTGINLNTESAEVKKGNTVQLTATIIPADAAIKDVSWASENNDIATVSNDGLVTGVSVGTANITATSSDNKKVKKTCKVTVTENHVALTGIALNKTDITLVKGKIRELSPIFKPYNATNTNITWSSRNPDIAKVDDNGLVKAEAAGTTRIIAKTKEGSFTAYCDVKVVDAEVPIAKIKLNTNSCNLKINDTKQLKVTITPSNVTNSDVFWSSDKASVATVDTNGLVTAKREGNTTIKVMTEDGSVSDSCFITVNKQGATSDGNKGTSSHTNQSQDEPSTVITSKAIFTDIAGSWAKKNIEQMVEFGVINGYQDGSFRPNHTVTRAEFVTMVVKVMEKTNQIKQDSSIVFEDTNKNWAKNYISTAVSNGFVKGYSDSIFGPDDEITREQMAAIIVRAFQLSSSNLQTSFVDETKISPWAKDVVNTAVGSKVMTGTTDNRFAPKDKATRAEAATVLLRVLQIKGYM